ncbi:MAG: hypothetical protein MUF58_12970 [Arcicella sp.]|jgi:hypothetical protein|nr:hypothetical protein [Arcicella sp.]
MITILENPSNSDNEEISISEETLNDFWNEITDSDKGIASLNAKHIFLEEFKRNTTHETGSDLYYKTKGWKIILKKNLLKGIIITPSLYGILSYLDITTGLASIVLPSIIPMIFDIENINLSKKEEEILLKLPVNKSKKQYKTAEEWYESLPKSIQEQVNFLDFKDFMDKLVLGGLAQTNQKDKYLIFKKGKNIFKISFE